MIVCKVEKVGHELLQAYEPVFTGSGRGGPSIYLPAGSESSNTHYYSTIDTEADVSILSTFKCVTIFLRTSPYISVHLRTFTYNSVISMHNLSCDAFIF